MIRLSIIIIISLIILGLVFVWFGNLKKSDVVNNIQEGSEFVEKGVMNSKMKFISPAFNNNESIPSKYTCDGENINPPLMFGYVPENAKSLVLVVDDPDAPGGDFTHWLLWNIDPGLEKIGEGSVPESAVQGLSDFGKNQYGGPCPPTGTHKYKFKLYALDVELDLSSDSNKADLESAIKDHVLEQTLLVGLYERR